MVIAQNWTLRVGNRCRWITDPTPCCSAGSHPAVQDCVADAADPVSEGDPQLMSGGATVCGNAWVGEPTEYVFHALKHA